jgi:dTDP-4-amino-4,6-dideoxygalactose transaminase
MFSVDPPTLRLRDVLATPNTQSRALLKDANVYYTCNARGALYSLLRSFPAEKGSVILAPAFHCVTAVEPIIRAGYKPLFYKINEDLSIDYDDLYSKLWSDIAAVVVINYFGFPTDISGILALREKYNYYVIEDWAHSFLDATSQKLTGDKGDFAIYSFRKLVPSYVGGGFRINCDEFRCESSLTSIGARHSIIILKRLAEEIIENSGDGLLRSTFRYIERKRVGRKQDQLSSTAVSNNKAHGVALSHDDLATEELPWFSKAIIHVSDFGSIVAERRRNYRLLDEHLEENRYIHKVFPRLPDHVCPWAYPVWIADRAKYDHQLRKLGIPVFTFGEVLHPLVYKCAANLITSVDALSNSLMMIPVHQNLDKEAMLFFCRTISQFFGEVEKK